MIKPPKNFADRPDWQSGSSEPVERDNEQAPDVLSVLLRAVRLPGEELFCVTPASPLAVSFNHPGGTIHMVGQGDLELELEEESDTRRYQRGDVFMLPTGRRHTIRDGRRVNPRPLSASDSRLDIVTHGDGTRWLAGTFSFDESRAAGLLHGLPPSWNCEEPGTSPCSGWTSALRC
jgi:hypothetical protein